MVKEIYLPFTGDMVRAILAGRKTQTTRPMEQPDGNWSNAYKKAMIAGNAQRIMELQAGSVVSDAFIRGQFGAPGDLLCVREAWRVGAWDEARQSVALDYRADQYARQEWIHVPDADVFERLVCQTLKDAGRGPKIWEPGKGPARWRPSIHMFKWACRLKMPITEIKTHPVQWMTKMEAEAEGCPEDQRWRAVYWFYGLWDQLYRDTRFVSPFDPWVVTYKWQEVQQA